MTLTERRAEFVYNAERLAAMAIQPHTTPAKKWSEHKQLFKTLYAGVIERQCGPQRLTSPVYMHDRWVRHYIDMGWVYGDKFNIDNWTHPHLVPYSTLDKIEQDKYSIFIALCEIARHWINDDTA